MTGREAVRGLAVVAGVASTGVVWAWAMVVALTTFDGVQPQDYGVNGRAAVTMGFLLGLISFPFVGGSTYVVSRALGWSVRQSFASSQFVTVALAVAMTVYWL